MEQLSTAPPIPTGDYVVEFLNYRGEVIPGTTVTCATLEDSERRAAATAPMLKTDRWRILRCMQNSTDHQKERWER